MNTLSHWLIRCYPAQWQERYAQEFMALLAQQPLTLSDAIDILRAAYDEHRRTPASKGAMPGLRLATAGLLASGALLVALLLAGFLLPHALSQRHTEALMFTVPLPLLASQPFFACALARHQKRRLPSLPLAAGISALLALGLALPRLYEAQQFLPTVVLIALVMTPGAWAALVSANGLRGHSAPRWVLVAGVLAGLSWCVLLAVALLSTAYPQWQGALNGLLPANAFLWLASQAVWTAAVCGWLWRSQARHAPAL
jgi:phosphoglycerol transferase MdoB-like AlkP superfamily enzyme